MTIRNEPSILQHMHIHSVEIFTPHLGRLSAFYRDLLQLPVVKHISGSHLEVQIGKTRLAINQDDKVPAGHYHFAFDIPENQFQAGFHWLKQRAQPIASASGQILFPSENWNSDSVYFKDQDGNILELIARHNQPNSSMADFSVHSLLSISEFGIASEDVPRTVTHLSENLSVQVYDGAGSQRFTAVGDEQGLLIIVQRGRVWMPDTGKSAEYVPFKLDALNKQGRIFQISAPPYPFEIQPV